MNLIIKTLFLILWYILCGLSGYYLANFYIKKNDKRRKEKIKNFVENIISDKILNTDYQEYLIQRIFENRW